MCALGGHPAPHPDLCHGGKRGGSAGRFGALGRARTAREAVPAGREQERSPGRADRGETTRSLVPKEIPDEGVSGE